MTANTRKPIEKLIKIIFTFAIIFSMLINTTFTTQAANKKPAKPAKTAITSVIRNASGKSITVKFKKIKRATGYQVAYKTSSDKKYTIKKTKKTAYTIKAKKNKVYSIKVRAYTTKNKKTVYSKWSKTKTINTAKNTCQHNWVTITDSEAWDEPIYEEQPIYERVCCWDDGTPCPEGWGFPARQHWCFYHCTTCYPDCPDPDPRGWCAAYNSCNWQDVIVGYETVQTGTKHHDAVTHIECSKCGVHK